jgi:hypothetical protein
MGHYSVSRMSNRDFKLFLIVAAFGVLGEYIEFSIIDADFKG